jgi:hypothetical protein
MKPSDIQIQLTNEALREFKEIQGHLQTRVSGEGKRYLRKLIHVPLERWQAIQSHWANGAFCSDRQLPFDIRGKVCGGPGKPKTILITRFKFRKQTRPQATGNLELSFPGVEKIRWN